MRKAAKDTKENKDSRELIEALEQLEKEKGFKKEVILDAVEQSLLGVCRKNFGKADNVFVTIDRETGELPGRLHENMDGRTYRSGSRISRRCHHSEFDTHLA